MSRRETGFPRARLASAFAVSLGCHAVVALALGSQSRFPAALAPRSAILVRVLGDAAANGPVGEGAAEPAMAAAAVVSSPQEPDRLAVANPPERPRPVHRRPPSAVKPAREAHEPVSEGTGPAVEGDATAAPAGAVGGETSGSGGSGIAPGGGGGGAGHGGGGGGADGLRAWCRSCPIPEYPPRARRQGWQGTVDVELRVSSDGTVEQASIGRSSGFAVLDSAAVTVARRSRFRLPEKGDGLRGQLRYRFVLEEAAAERSL